MLDPRPGKPPAPLPRLELCVFIKFLTTPCCLPRGKPMKQDGAGVGRGRATRLLGALSLGQGADYSLASNLSFLQGRESGFLLGLQILWLLQKG